VATSGMKFTHSAHISPTPKPEAGKRPAMLAMLTAGLAIGFMGMYFTVTRPMSKRMQMVESNLSLMQTEMHQLVGTRDALWKTNDLLTGLRQQQRQLAEAEQSLVSMRQMKNEVLSLASEQQSAMQTLQGMKSMQATLIKNQSSMDQSRKALASIAMLQKNMVKLGESAITAQAEIVTAQKTMNEMEKLTTRMVSQSENIASADLVIDSVDELSASLVQREEPLTHSKSIVSQMASLQDSLMQQTKMMPAAEETVQKMTALEDRLAGHDQEVAMQAASNLEKMMMFQKELSAGSEHITAAIQTVELMEGFQSQIEDQASMLSGMRRDLMEITFLESTVKQTLQVLKPLIQLSDLKRMSNTEVREAARVILDRRIADSRSHKSVAPTRVAEKTIESPKMTPAPVKEQLVPNPTDLD